MLRKEGVYTENGSLRALKKESGRKFGEPPNGVD
jgi:hypothetical protein